MGDLFQTGKFYSIQFEGAAISQLYFLLVSTCFALSVVFEFDSSAITLQQYCTGPPCSSD